EKKPAVQSPVIRLVHSPGWILKVVFVFVFVDCIDYGLAVFVCLKLFPGFESNRLAGRNRNLFTGARVSAHSAFSRFDDENAESAQLDSLAPGQSFLHRMEKS